MTNWRNSKTRDKINFTLLILAIALVLGGLVWGGVAQWLAEWDHAISRSEKVHIWWHLWFSPGISATLGVIILFIFKIRGTI